MPQAKREPTLGTPGVYVIRNLRTGAFYVGSTRDLQRRLAGHRSLLRRGAHQTPALQAAWAEAGEEAFEFTVLEELPLLVGHAALSDAEQHWDRHFRESGAPAYSKSFRPRAERSDSSPLVEGEQPVTLSVIMSQNQRDALQQIARHRQVAIGAVVREAIRDYLATTKY